MTQKLSITGLFSGVAKGFLGLLFLLGTFVTLSHYLPLPEAAKSPDNPLVEYVTQQLPQFDTIPAVSAAHVVPAFIFMLFVGLQLLPAIRRNYPRFHRINGRVLVVCSVIFAISGLIIGFVIPFGGLEETIVNSILTLLFLYFLGQGYFSIRQGQVTRHQIAMMRMIAVALTPVVMRIFFAPMVAIFDFAPREIFADLLAAGCILNLLITQVLVLRINRKQVSRKERGTPSLSIMSSSLT
jgi:uncharacterized membrane protein